MKARCVLGMLLSLAAVTMLMGCGGGGADRPDLGKVKCTVTVNGQPLTYGNIIFEPDRGSGTKGRPSMGAIKNGKVDCLTCYSDCDGAILGTHLVRIRCPKAGPAPAGATPPSDPASADGAPPMVEPLVGMGEGEPEDLIPAKYNSRTTLKRTVEAGSNDFKIELEISGFEMPAAR